jgi:hypothetical protein
MTETQSAHRQQLETRALSGELLRSTWGMIAGTVVTLGIEVISALLILKGYALAGAGMGGFWLVALAGVFVYGTRSRREERMEKARIMTEQSRPPLDPAP